jgi:hypothetical protein
MFDNFEINNECIDHVTGSFSCNTLQLEAPVQAGGKEPACRPHAEKEDAGIDAMAGQQAGVEVNIVHANGKKE